MSTIPPAFLFVNSFSHLKLTYVTRPTCCCWLTVSRNLSVSLFPSPTMARCPPRITFVVNSGRVNRVLQARRRRRTHVRPQLSPAERKRRREATQLNTTALDTAIEEWYQLTMSTAQELAKRFNHRQRWTLDKMFHRGAHVKKKNKTSAWNAWASQMCSKVNGGQYRLFIFVPLRLTGHRTQGGCPFTDGNP